MSSVTFKNDNKRNLSPKFLHISQINKLISNGENLRSKSPFETPEKSTKKRNLSKTTEKKEILAENEYLNLYSCELALSAKDFISMIRSQEKSRKKISEEFSKKDFQYLGPSIKKSFLIKKRSTLFCNKKIEENNNSSRDTSFSKATSVFIGENDLYPNLILYENTSEQSDIVWRFLNNNKVDDNEIKEIKSTWVQGLTKEERGTELYLKTIKIYGWHPKILSLQKLENV